MMRWRLRLLVALSAATLLSALLSAAEERAPKTARLAFVGPGTPFTAPRGIAAFWDRMRELGWIRSQNLVVEERWAEGRLDRLPALMAEAVALKPDVIVTYGIPAAIAAKGATASIPIVGATMADPVESGVVASLSHPGGNLTGLSAGFSEGFEGKWLELLQETVPRLSVFAVLIDPRTPNNVSEAQRLQRLAAARHLKLQLIELREADALDSAFKQARKQAQGALVLANPMFMTSRQRIVVLAARYRLPVVYTMRDYAEAGGLIAYGPDFTVMFRRAADYVDKILNGAKPGDLPIEQPTKHDLVVNLKTAKALGLTIPESILVRADEVIR
jgi:putative ABC transport system substrate-binding protein